MRTENEMTSVTDETARRMALIQRRFFHDLDIDRLPLAPRPPFHFVSDGLPFAQHPTALGGAAGFFHAA